MTPSDITQNFFLTYPHKTYNKAETIVEAGDTPKTVFYIEEGKVDQCDITASGDVVLLNSYKPGAFFAMSWTLAELSNSYAFIASEPTTVRVAPIEAVRQLLRDEPSVCIDILTRIVRGSEALLHRLNTHLGSDAKERVWRELCMLAERFGTTQDNQRTVTCEVKQLASQTGLARETVSRAIAQLKKDQKLTHEKNVFTIQNE